QRRTCQDGARRCSQEEGSQEEEVNTSHSSIFFHHFHHFLCSRNTFNFPLFDVLVLIFSLLGGIGHALGAGVAYFFAADALRRVGAVRSAFFVHLFGLIVALGLAILLKTSLFIPLHVLGLVFLAAICASAGYFFFYRALAIGPVSITSPIGSAYAL